MAPKLLAANGCGPFLALRRKKSKPTAEITVSLQENWESVLLGWSGGASWFGFLPTWLHPQLAPLAFYKVSLLEIRSAHSNGPGYPHGSAPEINGRVAPVVVFGFGGIHAVAAFWVAYKLDAEP